MFSLFSTKLFVILVFTLQHDSSFSREAFQVIVGTQSMFVELNLEFNKNSEELVLLLSTKGMRGLIKPLAVNTLASVAAAPPPPQNPMKRDPKVVKFSQSQSFCKWCCKLNRKHIGKQRKVWKLQKDKKGNVGNVAVQEKTARKVYLLPPYDGNLPSPSSSAPLLPPPKSLSHPILSGENFGSCRQNSGCPIQFILMT